MADIELVIKISEDVYTRLFDNGIQDNEIAVDDVCEMARAIRKGTPLPKGHGRLIDADYLREDFKASKKISFAERMDISCIVDHAPTIIEADKERTRMSIDEYINRFTAAAEFERKLGKEQGYEEFKHLAEWLKELKENKDVLDKIREEIARKVSGHWDEPVIFGIVMALEIIDRYKEGE